MAKYALIDCRPVPAKLAPVLRTVKAGTGANLNSCLRTQDAVNYARARGCTLSSQEELYNGYINGRPGFNPANPPGQSTHELRNDGVAYWGWKGRILRYWQVGMDWTDSDAVIAEFRKHGWIATRTYPGSAREFHHLNLRKEPKLKLSALKVGSKGRRVVTLTRRLAFVKSPRDHQPYLTHKYQTFTHEVERAVKDFQREHGLKADGVVGPATARQLAASTKWWKQHYKNKDKTS